MAEPTGYHRILERQLRRLGLAVDEPPDQTKWPRLLEVVSGSYREADADRYTLERSIDISSEEMRALHDVLRNQARHDALTGLLNRSALTEYLAGVLARRQQRDSDVAVLFIDLDDFKMINDRLGHSAGDELLKEVAERIHGAVRDRDEVARLGGDEFVVVCVDVEDIGTTEAIARRISAILGPALHVGGQEIAITASIGIAFSGAAPATTDDLLRQADMAMYAAKARGRSQYVVFDDAMRRQVEWRLSTEDALRDAIRADEFVLHYQPIVALGDQRLVGMEALIRWDRPDHGLLMPPAFIPIAEEIRLISAIDSWVIRTACEQATRWGRRDVAVAVNLSARDLEQPDIMHVVRTELDRLGMPPRQLILEITETTLVSDEVSIATNLDRIRTLGVGLAIDDFGTGYSSFSYLRQLPAQTLKIDRSFVALLEQDESAAAITGAIITMGHALGLAVVAEGVERQAQADRLRALGCDAAQGHLFAHPEPASRLHEYFASIPSGHPCRWPPVASP